MRWERHISVAAGRVPRVARIGAKAPDPASKAKVSTTTVSFCMSWFRSSDVANSQSNFVILPVCSKVRRRGRQPSVRFTSWSSH